MVSGFFFYLDPTNPVAATFKHSYFDCETLAQCFVKCDYFFLDCASSLTNIIIQQIQCAFVTVCVFYFFFSFCSCFFFPLLITYNNNTVWLIYTWTRSQSLFTQAEKSYNYKWAPHSLYEYTICTSTWIPSTMTSMTTQSRTHRSREEI